jgi:hypothetical protein
MRDPLDHGAAVVRRALLLALLVACGDDQRAIDAGELDAGVPDARVELDACAACCCDDPVTPACELWCETSDAGAP